MRRGVGQTFPKGGVEGNFRRGGGREVSEEGVGGKFPKWGDRREVSDFARKSKSLAKTLVVRKSKSLAKTLVNFGCSQERKTWETTNCG